MGRSRGVREERTDHTRLFSQTLAGFDPTGHQTIHFSTFDDKLKSQCIKNDIQNLPFYQQSLQRTLFFPRYLTIRFLQMIVQTTKFQESKI